MQCPGDLEAPANLFYPLPAHGVTKDTSGPRTAQPYCRDSTSVPPGRYVLQQPSHVTSLSQE